MLWTEMKDNSASVQILHLNNIFFISERTGDKFRNTITLATAKEVVLGDAEESHSTFDTS